MAPYQAQGTTAATVNEAIDRWAASVVNVQIRKDRLGLELARLDELQIALTNGIVGDGCALYRAGVDLEGLSPSVSVMRIIRSSPAGTRFSIGAIHSVGKANGSVENDSKTTLNGAYSLPEKECLLYLKDRSQCADHWLQLVSAAVNHFASHIENDCEPDIGEPTVLLK